MNKKIGFIGCVNMGKAMLQGIIKANIVKKEHISISTRSNESKE